jgi:hypothetical protein
MKIGYIDMFKMYMKVYILPVCLTGKMQPKYVLSKRKQFVGVLEICV